MADTGEARGNRVALDFHKAYNPPCALTPNATRPLPPQENRLAVRIEAGETIPDCLRATKLRDQSCVNGDRLFECGISSH